MTLAAEIRVGGRESGVRGIGWREGGKRERGIGDWDWSLRWGNGGGGRRKGLWFMWDWVNCGKGLIRERERICYEKIGRGCGL